MITLQFLGTGPEKPTRTRRNSALLVIYKGKRILFGCPPDILEQLKRVGVLPKDLVVCFITHAHPDHSGGREALERENVPIFFKKGSNILDMRIRAIPVLHSIKAPTVGFKITTQIGSFSYVPDFLAAPDPLFKVDLLIADGSSVHRDKVRYFPKGRVGHQSMRKTLDQAKRNKTKFVIFTHIGRVGYSQTRLETLLKKWGEERSLIALPARDFLRLRFKAGQLIEAVEEGSFTQNPKFPVMYLPAPHAELLAKREKTLIIKEKRYERMERLPVYVGDKSFIWAKIVLAEPEKLTLSDFEQRKEEHRVTDEERKRWWPDAKNFYGYKFQLLEVYFPPKRYKFKRGPQAWIRDYEFIDEPPKELAVEEIKNIAEYRPQKLTDAQLRDDWRILCAAFARKRRGERHPWSEEEIKRAAVLIARELAKRDAIVFKPYKMKKYSRELFDFVKRELGGLLPYVLVKEEVIRINPPFLEQLSIEELLSLHRNLHYTFAESNLSKELVFNAHMFVREELARRGKKHPRSPRLPKLSETDQRSNAHDYFLRHFLPIVVTHWGLSLAGSAVYKISEPHDCDWVVRNADRLPELEKAVKALLPEWEHHFVYETKGPNWDFLPVGDFLLWPKGRPLPKIETNWPKGFEFLSPLKSFIVKTDFLLESMGDFLLRTSIPDAGLTLKLTRLFPDVPLSIHHNLKAEGNPIADLIFVPCKQGEIVRLPEEEFKTFFKEWIQALEEAERTELEPLKPFIPAKAIAGYHKGEFFKIEDLIKYWARGVIERGIVVQPKADGFRMLIHRKGKIVKIFTEDMKRERANAFPLLVKEALDLPANEFILDTEFVLFEEGKPLPRREMVGLAIRKEPYREEDLRVFIHDLLYLDGRSLHNEPYTERLRLLKQLLQKEKRFLRLMPTRIAKSEKELRKALEWAADFAYSEGAMVKIADSIYPITGKQPRSPEWAKLKLVLECKVQVIGRQKKALPWETPPKEPITGDEAVKAYKRLAAKSKTWLYRCAFLVDKKLQPIERDATLTPADLELRWVVPGKPDPLTGKMVTGERGEWRGLADPAIWEMGLGFKDRTHKEVAYGTTYAANVEAKIGDILTVNPIKLRKFKRPDGTYGIAWMFPILREKDITRKQPDTLADLERSTASDVGIPRTLSFILIRLTLALM